MRATLRPQARKTLNRWAQAKTGSGATGSHQPATVNRCCFSLFMSLQRFGPTLGPTLSTASIPTGIRQNRTMDGRCAPKAAICRRLGERVKSTLLRRLADLAAKTGVGRNAGFQAASGKLPSAQRQFMTHSISGHFRDQTRKQAVDTRSQTPVGERM